MSHEQLGDAVAEAAMVVAESSGGLDFTDRTARSPGEGWRVEEAPNGRLDIVDREGKRLLRLPGSPQAIVATHDNQRLLVAGQDGAVRIYETAGWTELTAIQLNAAITGMSLSTDGTRLVLFTAGNGLQVWDTRRSAEREAADARYVEALSVARERPRDPTVESLDNLGELFANRSLTPCERVAALATVRQQLDEDVSISQSTLDRLKRELRFKDSVAQAVARMDLTPNQRRLIEEELGEWEQSEEERHQELPAIAENPDSPEELVRAALKIADKNLIEAPGRIGNRTRVPALSYRVNDLTRARDLFLEGTDWFTNVNRINKWNAHCPNICYLAMAEHKLGRRREAIQYLHSALRYWYGGNDAGTPFTPLQKEAAELIKPSVLTHFDWPNSEAFQAADAQDASQIDDLLSLAGEEVTAKGRVVRASPTANGSRANLGSV